MAYFPPAPSDRPPHLKPWDRRMLAEWPVSPETLKAKAKPKAKR